MKKLIKILLLFCCLFGIVGFVHSQSDLTSNSTFIEKLRLVRLLTDTQQYSEAMRQLKIVEKENALDITSSLKNEVDYRMMVARVLRLSFQFDDAMNQMILLPNLESEPKLKLEIDFRKAALYMENPKYPMEERMKIVYPIINEGIKGSKEINNTASLASFYNLKAKMHFDECALINRDCARNREVASDYYKKSMSLFSTINDTKNYHNVLNNYFRLSLVDLRPELDSLKKIVLEYADSATYFPNLTASRFLLGQYYVNIKNDSLNFFRQTILEKNAMIDAVNNNKDDAIGKLKLLYEFDSLKADINLNRDVIAQKDLSIMEKNRRISENIIFSIVLGALTIVLIFLFLKQRRLVKTLNTSNSELNTSNHNYQLLIKESHHRIKNNLQMILSIIELDKLDAESENRDLLTNISTKILTIAALHKILDFKEHNQKVELRTYFTELIQYFEDLSKNKIEFLTDFSDLKIQSEKIVYFGLILNELISNTLKHRSSEDNIIIQVLKSENSHIFIYRDNSNFGEYSKHSGINLVEDLINRFGGFDLKFDKNLGEYKFYFHE